MPSDNVSLSSALADLNNGRIIESIAQFKELLRTNPQNDAANFYLATLYTPLNELDVAERYLRRAMELRPNQGAHYYQLALIRYRQKQWRAALDLLKQALQLGTGNNDAAVWHSIGDVQLELFDRGAALQAYEKAFALKPQDAATQFALGRLNLEHSEPGRAIPYLRAALDIDPMLRAIYPVLGRAYRQLGNLPAALAVLRKAVDEDPADQDSRYALGQTLLASGSIDEGRAELEKYAQIRQQVTTANTDYGAAQRLVEMRQFSEAERLLRESVRLAPNYGPALFSLGTLLLDRGSPDKAVEMLKRAVAATPLNAAAWFSLGSAYLQSGKMSDALEAAKRAAILNDDAQYQHLLAEIEAKIKK